MFASNSFFFFFFFLHFLSIIDEAPDTSFRKPFVTLTSQTRLFLVKLSSIILIIILSIAKLIYSFTRVLCVTLFAGHKIDKTRIVTIQTMVTLKCLQSLVFYHILRNLLLFAMKITQPERNKYSAPVQFEMRPQVLVREFF